MEVIAEHPDNWKWKYPVIPILSMPVDSNHSNINSTKA
jgi:hypothetical protein